VRPSEAVLSSAAPEPAGRTARPTIRSTLGPADKNLQRRYPAAAAMSLLWLGWRGVAFKSSGSPVFGPSAFGRQLLTISAPLSRAPGACAGSRSQRHARLLERFAHSGSQDDAVFTYCQP
jgi:hypothetical protein